MNERTAEAILLQVTDLQEKDRIVAFVTPEFGRKRGVASGARRKYSRFAGLLQPLSKVQISWFEKQNRELVRIQDVSMQRAPHALQVDLETLLLGSYLAEHVDVFAQEDEASEALYRLLDTTIEALLAKRDLDLVARYFEIWVLRLAGIFPPPRECPLCLRPFPPSGAHLPRTAETLVCTECASAEGGEGGPSLRVDGSVLAFLIATAGANIEGLSGAPPNEAVLRQTERLCRELRRAFLGRELRSYEVMRRTLLEVG